MSRSATRGAARVRRYTYHEMALIETFRAAGGERVIRFRRGHPHLPTGQAEALARLVRHGRIHRHATLAAGGVSYRLRESAGGPPSTPLAEAGPRGPDGGRAEPPGEWRPVGAMTEAVWLAGGHPEVMLQALEHGVSARKLRWYAVACVRRLPPPEFTTFHWDVVHELEESIDGDGLVPAPEWGVGSTLGALITPRAFWAARGTAGRTLGLAEATRDESRKAQCALLRDIFGNPFRPVTLDPRWRTETAAALAAGIYADRAFDRMSILADALEEAGCDDADLLAHSRDPDATHVRGCWVVDMLLGKK